MTYARPFQRLSFSVNVKSRYRVLPSGVFTTPLFGFSPGCSATSDSRADGVLLIRGARAARSAFSFKLCQRDDVRAVTGCRWR